MSKKLSNVTKWKLWPTLLQDPDNKVTSGPANNRDQEKLELFTKQRYGHPSLLQQLLKFRKVMQLTCDEDLLPPSQVLRNSQLETDEHTGLPSLTTRPHQS